MRQEYVMPDWKKVQQGKDIASTLFNPNDIWGYGAKLQQAGQGALRGYAENVLGQQFTPQFAAARAGLAANPLLADSGFANRLNRRVLSDAYGAYMGQVGQMGMQTQDILAQLLQQRLGQRGQLLGQMLQPYQKPETGDYLMQAGGALGSGYLAGRKGRG